jgi:hypothetical protein
MSARSWLFFGSYFTSNVLVLVLNELNLIHFLEVLAVHASPLFSLNHFSYSSSFPFFSSCWNPECSHLKVFSNLIIKISLYMDILASYRYIRFLCKCHLHIFSEKKTFCWFIVSLCNLGNFCHMIYSMHVCLHVPVNFVTMILNK